MEKLPSNQEEAMAPIMTAQVSGAWGVSCALCCYVYLQPVLVRKGLIRVN